MIERWDIITIGNLSRNRYWGESDERALRSAICTSTLITTDSCRLLVDPSLTDIHQMATELDRRVGLKLAQIDYIFITHEHGDHHAGLAHFEHAQWFAASEVADNINHSARYARPVQGVETILLDDFDVLHTPGHTPTHHSLRFDCHGQSVVVAGDATMTRDFWRYRQGYFNSVDFDLVAVTMDQLAEVADIIVPGHDNWFLNRGLVAAG